MRRFSISDLIITHHHQLALDLSLRVRCFGSDLVHARHKLLDPHEQLVIARQLQPFQKLFVLDRFFCLLCLSHKATVHLFICVNAHSLWIGNRVNRFHLYRFVPLHLFHCVQDRGTEIVLVYASCVFIPGTRHLGNVLILGEWQVVSGFLKEWQPLNGLFREWQTMNGLRR